jgi:ubiquinone biosynthesis accessory factor UbiK
MKENLLRDIAKKLAKELPKDFQKIQKDIEKNFHAVLKNAFKKLDLITREEFDAQTKVLARSRKKLEELIERVNELEKKRKK